MSYYRILTTLNGPLATDLVSGTLWGHLAWAVRYLEGEEAFESWLEEQNRSPWLVSSHMPEGMLPRPLLAPSYRPEPSCDLPALDAYKQVKKIGYIPEDLFLELRNRMSEKSLMETLIKKTLPLPSFDTLKDVESDLKPLRYAHNRIDRLSGRTPESGGLFFQRAVFAREGARRQFFVCTRPPEHERLRALFDHIGQNGFGANASTGFGAATYEILEADDLFAARGNRAMTLSHGVISGNMTNSRFKQHTHFGKLGGHFATGGFSPFKYPILMAKPGATFTPSGTGPFGELLAGVHHDPELSLIRHHALHLPLFFSEVES